MYVPNLLYSAQLVVEIGQDMHIDGLGGIYSYAARVPSAIFPAVREREEERAGG